MWNSRPLSIKKVGPSSCVLIGSLGDFRAQWTMKPLGSTVLRWRLSKKVQNAEVNPRYVCWFAPLKLLSHV